MKKRLSELPLRSGVGIVVLNKQNKVFVAKRIDNPKNFWQMPQGGVDEGENFLNAAYRELEEETSIKKVNLIQLQMTPTPQSGRPTNEQGEAQFIPSLNQEAHEFLGCIIKETHPSYCPCSAQDITPKVVVKLLYTNPNYDLQIKFYDIINYG